MDVWIAGVDEVGRGPLAGPVITAAVILRVPMEGLRDSKALSANIRNQLVFKIKYHSLCWAYGRAEVEEIDRLNIHNATLLAMKRAIEALPIKPTKVLVDGLHIPAVSMYCKAIVKGDTLIPEIAAASILAKVLRDDEMEKMHSVYPEYGFHLHKGYPTAKHREILKTIGPCLIHRRSYAPVSDAYKFFEMQQENERA